MVEPVAIASQYRYCIEVYLPKRVAYLSELYRYLEDALNHDPAVLHLDGCSIYEVDGAFRGQDRVWEERSLVIRILVPTTVDRPELQHTGLIAELGREIKAIARQEEVVWLTHYPQSLAIIRSI